MKKHLVSTVAVLLISISAMAQTKVTFMPHWTAQAQFVGYYMALDKGFYADEGLDVTIQHPNISQSNFAALQAGECQFTTTFLINALMLWDEGCPMRNIMQTSQGSTQMCVSREPLRSVSDLKGKKIARWSTGFNTLGEIVNKELGLEIEWIPFIWNVGLYKSGAIDAVMCQSYNEYFELLASGEEISQDQIIYISKIGYDVPEDGLYVLEDYYEKNPEVVKKFAAASRKGWQYAYEHRDEALALVMKIVEEQGIMTNNMAQKWMLDKVLEATFDGDLDLKLAPKSLDFANVILRNNGYISKAVSYQNFVAE